MKSNLETQNVRSFCKPQQLLQIVEQSELNRDCLVNLKVDTPLFATNANPLQLYYSPWAKILDFKFHTHYPILHSRTQNAKYSQSMRFMVIYSITCQLTVKRTILK